MYLNDKYEVLEAVEDYREDRAASGRELASGKAVTIQFLAGGFSRENNELLLAIGELPVEHQAHMLGYGEFPGVIYVVTDGIPDSQHFREWVRQPDAFRAPPATAVSPPEAAGALEAKEVKKSTGEFTRFLRAYEQPKAPELVVAPEKRVPAAGAGGGAPAHRPGDFTRMVMAYESGRKAESAVPPVPAAPASEQKPRQPEAGPLVRREAAPPAPAPVSAPPRVSAYPPVPVPTPAPAPSAFPFGMAESALSPGIVPEPKRLSTGPALASKAEAPPVLRPEPRPGIPVEPAAKAGARPENQEAVAIPKRALSGTDEFAAFLERPLSGTTPAPAPAPAPRDEFSVLFGQPGAGSPSVRAHPRYAPPVSAPPEPPPAAQAEGGFTELLGGTPPQSADRPRGATGVFSTPAPAGPPARSGPSEYTQIISAPRPAPATRPSAPPAARPAAGPSTKAAPSYLPLILILSAVFLTAVILIVVFAVKS